MSRQKIRKLTLIISLLLFPVTIFYFSPVLIIGAGLRGIINGSFIVFVLMLFLSIPFGRLFCAYLCPAGGMEECAFAINDKVPKQGWRNRIKYVIWAVWIMAVAACYIYHGEIITVDFTYETNHGISISALPTYIIYYGIVLLIFLPCILGGRRVFCHYFCWMAPFMIIGTKARNLLHLPGIHISSDKEKCISCGRCTKACPMGLDAAEMAKRDDFSNAECIQCGACIDACNKDVLYYKIKQSSKGESHVHRKEA